MEWLARVLHKLHVSHRSYLQAEQSAARPWKFALLSPCVVLRVQALQFELQGQ
jgi:hypothetical protein